MIIGIGIDLIEVKRIKALLNKTNLGRIFTAQEMKYCRSKKNPAESFAARFAAKEAFLKAIGTGWGTAQSPKWNGVEVVNNKTRNSQLVIRNLRLSGKAKSICWKLKVTRTHLSLTHTKDYAMAVVILEGE
ncbi:MAG: holo-ACP synthase [Planctomycetota bacterium]